MFIKQSILPACAWVCAPACVRMHTSRTQTHAVKCLCLKFLSFLLLFQSLSKLKKQQKLEVRYLCLRRPRFPAHTLVGLVNIFWPPESVLWLTLQLFVGGSITYYLHAKHQKLSNFFLKKKKKHNNITCKVMFSLIVTHFLNFEGLSMLCSNCSLICFPFLLE